MEKNYDKLTDVISFGVAPAFIMYFWILNSLGRIGWLLSLIYVVCVALRLARFNINTKQNHHGEIIFLRYSFTSRWYLILSPLIYTI